MPWHVTKTSLLVAEETSTSQYAKWEAAYKMLDKLGTGVFTVMPHSRPRVRVYKQIAASPTKPEGFV